ncbi:MAG: HD domain-containing protein [Candidatus Thermoplasmatota archaeon]
MTDIYHYDKKKDEQTIINVDSGRRKKEQFIENLREGDAINDFFAVKLKKPPRSYKKGVFFEFIASDKTGEIPVKFWGGDNKERVKRIFDSFSVGDVVQIRSGMTELYEEKPQISINENTGGIRRCSLSEYDVSDFIRSLDENQIASLYEIVKKEIKEIKNEQLKNLLHMFFDDSVFVKEYIHAPSAITNHHNYVGGNLQHVVGVLQLCKHIVDMYPSINKDLLITGAILHDVGKIKEYKYGAAIDKSDQGIFIGHIIIGDRLIREKIALLRSQKKVFSEDLENHLSHLILAHHGRYEWGSPRLPKTIEACVLHYADLMDSQVKNFMQNLDEARKNSDEDWTYIFDSDLGKKRAFYLGDVKGGE